MSNIVRGGKQQSELGSEKRSRRTLGVPVCPRHEEFPTRLEYFGTRDIVAERGIAVHELGDTPIPDIVERRGWHTFVGTPPMYCRRVVEEFYASMVPEYFHQHGVVMVRGVEVHMTADDINRYYNTELPEDPELVGKDLFEL